MQRSIGLFAIVLMTSVAAAQEAPPVAKQMSKCEALVGNWEGSGFVRAMPGMPEMPWTSTTTVKKILDGHFIIDQTKIEIEGMPVPLVMTSVTGWDSANCRRPRCSSVRRSAC